jgi:hypothetical protein
MSPKTLLRDAKRPLGPEFYSHLGAVRTARRANRHGRAYPLSEKPPEMLVGDALAEWLDVEKSARYQPENRRTRTFCNIYAHDWAFCQGHFLPRTWWRSPLEVEAGQCPILKVNVVELNANSLADWIVKWGLDFGWVVDHVSRSAADYHGDLLKMTRKHAKIIEEKPSTCMVVSARAADRRKAGHIAAVLPAFSASLKPGQLRMSQAGGYNRKSFISDWHLSPSFDMVAFAYIGG